jgi:hypothetical protein
MEETMAFIDPSRPGNDPAEPLPARRKSTDFP